MSALTVAAFIHKARLDSGVDRPYYVCRRSQFFTFIHCVLCKSSVSMAPSIGRCLHNSLRNVVLIPKAPRPSPPFLSIQVSSRHKKSFVPFLPQIMADFDICPLIAVYTSVEAQLFP
jgi:hypothetical protein